MTAEVPPLTARQVAAYQAALGIMLHPGSRGNPGRPPEFAVEIAVLEALDRFFDRQSRPADRLTSGEKAAMRACRERFGLYDPTSVTQALFLMELAEAA